MTRDQSDSEYTGYQAAFIRDFLSEFRPGSLHLLVAPVGSGKSFAMAGAVSNLIEGRAERVLVLAPTILTEQWKHLLRKRGVKHTQADAPAVRLIMEGLADGSGTWPTGVYPMSRDLATRADLREPLAAAGWDVVVVDEGDSLNASHLELIERLTSVDPPPALLVAGQLHDLRERFGSRARVFDWGEEVRRFWNEVSGGNSPLLRRETRSYRRTGPEAELMRQVLDVAQQLGPADGMPLLHAAASSIHRLEEVLLHGAERGPYSEALRTALSNTLDTLEGLRSDARLTSFSNLIRELSDNGARHVVVFCDYRSTLDYLSVAAQALPLASLTLNDGSEYDECQEVASRFEAEGGLLIVAATPSEGLSLSFVEAAVHYDLPLTAAAFAQREGRYWRYERRLPCTQYFFEDESGSLPLEGLLLRTLAEGDPAREPREARPEDLFEKTLALEASGGR